MSQAKSLSNHQIEQAFDVFNQVSQELDTSYRELQSRVTGLTEELMASRSARIAELAEKERLAHRLGALVSVLPGGVLILDRNNKIRDANPWAVELLGQPLLGETWQDVLNREKFGQQPPTSELQLKSGRRVSLVSRSLDESGDRVVLITDVTDNYRLLEQLERKKRLTALGEMAARLAHQIRTPLSSTTLYLSQLSRQDLPEKKRLAIASKLGERLGHMGSLIDSMLTFVRGDTPVTERILLRDVLDSFEATVRPQLERDGARLDLPWVDDSLALVGDADELVAALCNLAMNAIEAAGSSAELTLWVGALDRNRLQLRLKDNGPGIDEAIIDRVFDPFFTARVGGTGLGLAVVARIVSNHGGEVTVNNVNGGSGAEFVITLPIAADGSD